VKNIRETGSVDRRHGSGRPKHASTEENVTAVDELLGPTKPGRPATNTSFNTPDIQRDRSNKPVGD